MVSSLQFRDHSGSYAVDISKTEQALSEYKDQKVCLQLVKGKGQIYLQVRDPAQMNPFEKLQYFFRVDVFGFKDVSRFLSHISQLSHGKDLVDDSVKVKMIASGMHYNDKCWFEDSKIGSVFGVAIDATGIPAHAHLRRGRGYAAHYEIIFQDCEKKQSFQPYADQFRFCQKGDGLDLTQGKYDIYDPDFQDFALRMTNGMDLQKRKYMEKSDRLEERILIRARSMAIATRSDIGWDGLALTMVHEKIEKAKGMQERWNSLKLYKSGGGPVENIPKGPHTTKISVHDKIDTESALETLISNGANPHQTAILNMANSYNLGGCHQGKKGAQEEEVAMACDVIANLGRYAVMNYGTGRALYREVAQIPTGGNYCCKTRFINSKSPMECVCISHAFADFRPQGGSGEYHAFKKLADGITLDTQDAAYQKRIKLDMRAVLRTAKAEGVINLVLGASGCGAFKHDAAAEGKAWKEVLQESEFDGHFSNVIFPTGNNTVFSNGLMR